MISAKNLQEIGNHCRLSFIVKLHNLIFTQTIKGHLYHTECSVNNQLSGVNHSGGLLSLKHSGSNTKGSIYFDAHIHSVSASWKRQD